MRRYGLNSSLPAKAAILGLAVFFVVAAAPLRAQWPAAQPGADQPYTLPPTEPSEPPANVPRLTPDQLNDLVAPIALYPDPMLSQALVASTYPLELVEAEQWVKGNPNLRGQQLVDAAKQQPWDPSVQAMVAFPDVLDRLTSNIRWTTDLGNAFLAQQQDVMAAVQRLRAQAQANGKLNSNQYDTVTTATDNGQSAIQIMPANPDVMYVPYYDPAYVWGPPAWGYYPSLWYPPYGFGWWPGVNIGFYFGGWGGWGWGGYGWGWGPGWFGRGLFVNTGFFGRYGFRGGFGLGYRGGFAGGLNRALWTHDPSHRLGVAYPNRQLTSRFGAASMASRANMTRAGFGATGGMRNSFGGNALGSRTNGGGMRDSFGQTRGGYSGGAAAGRQGYQSFRGSAGAGGQGFSRGYSGGAMRSYQPSQSFRGSSPAGGGYRGFSGAPAYRGPSGGRSFGGGSAPAFRGGSSGARSFGGGARSFGGGGGHSFGGGGGHSFGGGGGHSGGGGHGGGHR